MKDKRPCIDVIGLDRCTGCFGCQTDCPHDSIPLSLDAEGFYKPVVNRETCTNCGFCQRRCPVIAYDKGRLPSAAWPEPKVFAAWTVNESLRLASSSGGLFSELARPVIDAGGTVAGCVWGENWTPKHVLARTWDRIEQMRGSKYVPSLVGNVFSEIVQQLKTNPGPALFAGTPCQVAAMDLALNREQRQRVLLVEVICHGVPSLRVFHSYLQGLFQGEPVVSYTFRDKTFGWQSVRARTASGRCHHMNAPEDTFFTGAFIHHFYMMAACYDCQFARLPRSGDVTLGDFWKCPEKWNDKRGVSLVLANTQAGLEALEIARADHRIVLESSDVDTAIHSAKSLMSGKREVPLTRRVFLDGVKAGKPFATLVSRHFPSHWQLWWRDFRRSKGKVKLLSGTVARRLRWLTGYH